MKTMRLATIVAVTIILFSVLGTSAIAVDAKSVAQPQRVFQPSATPTPPPFPSPKPHEPIWTWFGQILHWFGLFGNWLQHSFHSFHFR
jgi:hypothetical protein